MTEKEKLIARLKALGQQLGREINVAGTSQELAMRVAELEEELGDEQVSEENTSDAVNEPEPGEPKSGDDSNPDASLTSSGEETEEGLVKVETLTTLHIEALHETRDEPLTIVHSGVVIRVTYSDAVSLIEAQLAREC